MRRIKRKLSAPWSDRRRYYNMRKMRGKFRDAIAGNHYAHKRANLQLKGKLMNRKWNNRKLGYHRKRYYVNK